MVQTKYLNFAAGSAIVKAKPGNVVKITYLDEVGMPKENYAE